jgi:aminopeptidase N
MSNNDSDSTKTKKFELPGSIAHYPQLLSYTIDYMWLKIKPDFDSETLKDCVQRLKFTLYEDVSEIKLDIAEINVHQVTSNNISGISFDNLRNDDKLIIKLGQTLPRDSTIDLTIIYSTGYYNEGGVADIRRPRSGFYFVSSNKDRSDKQAWTQGEALESKYWFPCIDDPQVKFPREIQVTVPENDFIVISNGELSHTRENTWTWIESNPIPAYLTSVVIGKFAQEEQEYCYGYDSNNGNRSKIALLYYWPQEIPKKDAMLTFASTPNIIRFLEEYFGIKYPYKKYSQVAVEEFELAGMENSSCTTLTKDILHDRIAATDYTRDIEVISHELAHQWFGNLVTCRDWSNIWLNEGFATYCEVLYWERIKGFDEFCYKVIKIADEYFEECKRLYKRPIGTRVYKQPDDLFDAHSYEKAGCVLHMLRNEIGDANFRESVNKYLTSYENRTAETDDLRKVVEGVTRKSLTKFFDQWIYRAGHPILEIEFSLEPFGGLQKAKIKISQIQKKEVHDNNKFNVNDDYSVFEFDLDVRVALFTAITGNNEALETIHVSKRITEHSIKIPKEEKIEWIAIDPEFKILKEIRSVRVVNETGEFRIGAMLKNQLRRGNTIIERIEAARALKNHYSEDIVEDLQNAVMTDQFFGVSIEASNALGSYHDKDNYVKDNKAYQALISCLMEREEIFSRLHPEIKQAVIRNIARFERKESIILLEPLLYQQDESYFVRANASTAIGKSSKDETLDNTQKIKVTSLLKEIVNTSRSFRNIISSGAIDGLKELSNDKNKAIVCDIADFIIENTDPKNDYFKRLAATAALSKFLYTLSHKEEKNTKVLEISQKVFSNLLQLLKDKRRRVKINACKALADPDAKQSSLDSKTFKTVEELINVAEHDLDGSVRKEAERSINIIREWISEWSRVPLTLKIKIREE